jgi:hypothetical protein
VFTTLRKESRTWLSSTISGVLSAGAVFALVAGANVAFGAPAHAADAQSSAVTVKADPNDATAPMPNLEVTVSQTKNLVAQGIELTWKGGLKSTAPSAQQNGGENFLQIFMCWKDDPASTTPRPDRTSCQYGGSGGEGAKRDASRPMALADIPAEDQQYSAPGLQPFLPPLTAIPFVSRAGEVVSRIKVDPATGARSYDDTDINSNQFFTANTTNEVPWAGSDNEGNGSVTFEVQTAVQADGLGCGTPITSGSTTTGASCWLVVLPRGTSDNGSVNITQSGLFIDSWRHALAVKMDFAPVGIRCPAGQPERQLAGSELAALAVNAWQPVVCNQQGGSVYSLITSAESNALDSAANQDDAPLALTSYPMSTDETDPLQYAPVALTGVTISVAIDRKPNPNDRNMPPEYADAAMSRFSSVNLTPRLLAKLLSYSYRSAIPVGADMSYLKGTNPYNITEDPDFLAANDKEWASQELSGPAIADVIMPQGRSDAARAVWAYIGADADARDFLASKPDPWGMIVNPYYSTDATVNPTQTPFSLDRDDFPKADPIEVAPRNQGPMNLVTWRPYASDLGTIAYLTLRGDGLLLGTWDAFAVPVAKYNKGARMLPGNQALLGVTSASAAERYQVVTASLRNPSNQFVAPTEASMRAASVSMSSSDAVRKVFSLDLTSEAAKGNTEAYPLTLPVYAANNPAKTDPTLRSAYAAFIRYAVSSAAQTPGVDVGQLPAGYVPLPESWVAQALAAADAIDNNKPVVAPPPAASSGYVPPQSRAANPQPAPADPSPAAAAPAASGAASAPLSGGKTPDDPDTGAIAAAVPASLLAGVGGAAAVPLITRLRRRVI